MSDTHLPLLSLSIVVSLVLPAWVQVPANEAIFGPATRAETKVVGAGGLDELTLPDDPVEEQEIAAPGITPLPVETTVLPAAEEIPRSSEKLSFPVFVLPALVACFLVLPDLVLAKPLGPMISPGADSLAPLQPGDTAAADADGASGIKGRRRTGFLTAVLGTALISSAQNVGRKDTTNSNIAEAARIATGTTVGTLAEQYYGNTLSQGPTFAVRAGTILNAQTEREFYLEGYTQ